MASIEERIVRMEFDNSSFERKMSSTIASIEKLNASLAKAGQQNGLEQISKSASNFHMDGIAQAVDGISAKFVALGTIAITALANITNRAVDAGIQIAKSLTLDQVASGFQEYELKLGSIQTIMAGSGESLDVVNQKLQELNEYSDRTIYSFSDMTENIGKFTNAGVSLDQSVAAIKGIANVAALSGANSNEAARAMYNFAQALSKGHVQLIDWKSIELANMGTVEFKQQLIDAAEATGELTKQGDHWVTSAGNSVSATEGFNESLTDQWLTTEVLTNTLEDYSDATTDIGKRATAAAQDVKTFSQLMGTIKESIGSGWAQSFEILIGNFDEAKELFTGINNVVGDWVKTNADARNELLQGWKDMGGRTLLIDSLSTAFKNLGKIFAPIKEAFREIFPAKTAEDLYRMTEGFSRFAEALKPSEQTVENLKRIFKGLFSILSIGWTVIKEGIGFIGQLLKSITGAGSGAFLEFAAKIGDFFTNLQEGLVKGEGIKKFFDGLAKSLEKPLQFIKDLAGAFASFFGSLGGGAMDSAGNAADRLGSRFESLKNLMSNLGDIWHGFADSMGGIIDVLDNIWKAISEWFGDLGNKLAAELQPGDFNEVVDALNVGLLGGIALLLRQFLKNGLSLDFGGGFLSGIKDSFTELTGVLQAMQTNLKANALLKIAGAIGIMAVALLLLSTINSADLTAALAAMAIGFGQLVGVMYLLDKAVSGPVGAAKLGILAAGLIMLSVAILILAGAVKLMASMSWGELIKGLVGVAVVLALLVAASIGLSLAGGPMLRASISMIAMAVALNLLALAVKQFSKMSWQDLGKGMASIAVGLGLMALALNLMPNTAVLSGAGLLMTAGALVILAGAVKLFSKMSWTEIGKGMAAVAGGLLIIGLAMNLMPWYMPLIGAGLILVATSLTIIAGAMKLFGSMSWSEIARGLTAMAGALLVLAIAANAMTGAIVGAIAIGILAGSLVLLLAVVKGFASLSIGELVTGLLALAGVLAILGLASYLLAPLIPTMMALGIAIILLGGGFALLGLGAMGVAKALQILAETGGTAINILLDLVDAIIERIPALMESVAMGLIGMASELIEAAPIIIGLLKVLIEKLLDTLITLVPKAVELVITFVEALLLAVTTLYPQIVQAGIDLILALLQGIRDNIDDVVTLVGEIVVAFLTALEEQIPDIVEALVSLVETVLTTVAEALGELAPTLMIGVGRSFIEGFWKGMKEELSKLWQLIQDIVDDCIQWFKDLLGIGSPSTVFIQIGKDLMQGFINGIKSLVGTVTSFFVQLPGRIVGWIGGLARTLWQKGSDLISGLYNAASTFLTGTVWPWISSIPGKILGWIGNTVSTLKDKGYNLIVGFYNGAIGLINSTVIPFFSNLGSKIVGYIGNIGSCLLGIGKSIIQGLWDGMQDVWGGVGDWLGGLGSKIVSWKGPPEKDAVMLYENGQLIFQGLQKGMEDEWDVVTKWLSEVNPADAMGNSFASSMNKVVGDMSKELAGMEEFNPVVTPVLDLTRLQSQAGALSGMLSANGSYSSAQSIAATSRPIEDTPSASEEVTSAGNVTFEQNIYAPKQLSTADIYKQTRNQIIMAKEELAIP